MEAHGLTHGSSILSQVSLRKTLSSHLARCFDVFYTRVPLIEVQKGRVPLIEVLKGMTVYQDKASHFSSGVPLSEVPLIEVSTTQIIGRLAVPGQSVPFIEVSHLAKSHLSRFDNVSDVSIWFEKWTRRKSEKHKKVCFPLVRKV